MTMDNKNSFPYKGFGRIIVGSEADKQRVSEILREIDDFEFGYMPKDMIAVEGIDSTHLVYVGKFEPDLDELDKRLKAEGIGYNIQEETYMDHEGIPEDVFNPYEI